MQQSKTYKTLNDIMKKILDLSQSSLPENQFKAFRKIVMDYFAEGKRQLGKDRCGNSMQDHDREETDYD